MAKSFNLDEIAGVQVVAKQMGYCNCCDEKTTLTYKIKTFDGTRFLACEDCGRKVQLLLNRRDGFN